MLINGLVRRAIARSHTGRNSAGFWLACQLRDNAVPHEESQVAMRRYQADIGPFNTKGLEEPYTVEEAMASLRQAYSAPARQPTPAVRIIFNGGAPASAAQSGSGAR